MKLNTFYLLGLLFITLSCGNQLKDNTDSATSGRITITADEGLKPIVDAELEVFQGIYPAADIKVIYTNEYDAISLMCKDSARIAIVTRDLLPEEIANFQKDKITPRYSPFAYDAIAVVMNKQTKDTVLTIDQLTGLLNGTIKTWKDLNPKQPATPIKVVFDDPKSGIIRFCRDSLLKGKDVSSNCFAVKSNAHVIEKVKEDANTIGLIGVALISDQDDSLMHSFSKQIIVASLVPYNPSEAEATTMKPYQAYIGLKQYPLWRKVQIISREARVGLGTGFASFIASDKGQRIVLKSGLVPALAPIRIIQLNTN